MADFSQIAVAVGLPHFAAVHTQLTGKAAQLGHVIQGHAGTRLVKRQQIHQIAVAGVVPADVVIPFELAAVGEIALAHIPITWRGNTVYQAAVM